MSMLVVWVFMGVTGYGLVCSVYLWVKWDLKKQWSSPKQKKRTMVKPLGNALQQRATRLLIEKGEHHEQSNRH